MLLVRYHDGVARTNWGGRATSLALAQIIDRRPDAEVGDVVNGIWLTREYEARLSARELENLQRLKNAAWTDKLVTIVKKDKYDQVGPIYDEAPRKRAERLLALRSAMPALDDIVRRIEASDELVVNGEGDFILTQRRSLWRCLVIMELANVLGRPVHLVNTMLSRGSDGETDPAVAEAVGATLRNAMSVSLRDRESVRLCQELFPDVRASFCPDALFSWREALARGLEGASGGPIEEGMSHDFRHALERPYVAVSGGSLGRAGADAGEAETRLENVLEALTAAGCKPVVVATCTGDNWMLKVADRLGAPRLPSDVPLAVGAHVLGRARAYLSGRYHPAILASLAGTPTVFMKSNSHKTRSLPELLGSAQTTDLPFFNQPQDVSRIVEMTVAAAGSGDDERKRLIGAVDGLAREAEALPLPASS